MSTATAAATLKVSTRRVRAMIASGQLRAHRDGREWLIDMKDVSSLQRRGAGRPPRVYRDDRPFSFR